MLYDSEFLRALDEYREKTTYARVIALDIDENPIEQIEGRITQGSVNIDGNSAVRRTCSLTMVSQDININDYYWGLNTKFKLEIGVQNMVSKEDFYPMYPDIIWFKMGTFIITQLSTQLSANNFTMSLQGKDKMCLLNGDVGGVINATTDFGTYDYYDTETGITTNYKLPIKDILWDMIHAYANEPFSNIVINDLDELGLELLEYRYDTPLYLIRQYTSDEYQMITTDGDFKVGTTPGAQNLAIKSVAVYDNLTSSMLGDETEPTKFYVGNYQCCAAKITYGQTAGYRTCDLVYAGDLIANIGDSVTSVLDKIKSMLGEFEYFYDLDGKFVFQRKKSLVNTVWTPQRRDGDNQLYVEALALASNSIYNFNGTVLISSFQNSPNLANLRNDFTVWGARKGIAGSDIPIHMRYAIDNKPIRYVLYDEDIALTPLTEAEIDSMSEFKTIKSRTTNVQDLWNHFKKNQRNDPLMYPDAKNMDSLWWEIVDWAEYYKILFNEYPGKRHPDDEMRNYCTHTDKTHNLMNCHKAIFEDGNPEGYDMTVSGSSGAYTNTVEVFFFEQNGVKTCRLQAHGGCIHTYEQFLDSEFYVNSGFKTHAEIDLGNGKTYDFTFQGIYYQQSYLDNLRDSQGLYHYLVYAYDPQIPPNRMEAAFENLEVYMDETDPWAGKYQYGIDWRELIYRMAKDYRKHNHEDDFERTLATRNYPLYPTGITGYEQYYTDLEGFWRQLYSYPLPGSKERQSQMEFEYKYYPSIVNRKDDENLYIKGCFKPIGQKVKNTPIDKIPKEKLQYYIKADDKYYYLDDNKKYGLSTDEGFHFSWRNRSGQQLKSNLQITQWLLDGQIYDMTIPSITQIYKIDSGGFYKYLDLKDFTTGQYYQKIINKDLPGGCEYKQVTKDTSIYSPDAKAGLYFLENQSIYTSTIETIESLESEISQQQAILNQTKDEDARSTIYETIRGLKEDLANQVLNKSNLDNGGLNYILVSDKFQAEIAELSDSELAKLYIYDDINKYQMKVVRNGSAQLSSVYGPVGSEIPQDLVTFIRNNAGQRTVNAKKTSCTYYEAYSNFYDANEDNAYWNKTVFEAPQSLNFWFDFLVGDNELRQFTTQAVGDRPKAVNETSVKSIYYRDTPKIIFTTQEKYAVEEHKTGYNYMILPDMKSYENMFTISAQGIDAKNKVDELLYQHSYCTESIQINAIPIYYLDVNKRIHVYDKETGINGDYVVSRISYPLSYNGMMSITATKAPENSVTEREA